MNKVEINFKSGNKICLKVKNFTAENTDGTLSKIEWEGIKKPYKILYICLEEIESIVQI